MGKLAQSTAQLGAQTAQPTSTFWLKYLRAGYSNSLDAFGWDDAPVTHPMQYSAAQFSRQPAGSHLDSRQQHPSLLARQAFSSELRQRDVGSGDLNSGMSLPNSSGRL